MSIVLEAFNCSSEKIIKNIMKENLQLNWIPQMRECCSWCFASSVVLCNSLILAQIFHFHFCRKKLLSFSNNWIQRDMKRCPLFMMVGLVRTAAVQLKVTLEPIKTLWFGSSTIVGTWASATDWGCTVRRTKCKEQHCLVSKVTKKREFNEFFKSFNLIKIKGDERNTEVNMPLKTTEVSCLTV